jgi:hypothetical protein
MGELLTFASVADRADAGAFLARMIRLDPAALVRVRCSGGRVALWGWLPLEVLVTRVVRGDGPGDATVGAADLLAALAEPTVGAVDGLAALAEPAAGGLAAPAESTVAMPGRRDEQWRGALPPAAVDELDAVPAEVIQRLLVAGERTFREASTGADPRAVGDALLDHETVTVSAGGTSAAVPLRLLLGLARMGFLGDDPVRIGVAGGWVRAAASYGAAYRRRAKLTLLSP